MNIKVNIKFFIIIASSIIMLFLMRTFSLANDEYSVFMTLSSDSTLKEGEMVAVNVNLSNIDAGNGINALVAKLNYDSNVFEMISVNDFCSNTNWNVSYSSITNKLTAVKNTKVTTDETMFTINLKAKSKINVGSTTVSLQNIFVSGGMINADGTGDINVNNISISFNKIETPPINYSASMTLTTNSSLKDNESVIVNAYLSNINAGNGINALVAKLNYDSNVFEIVGLDNFSSTTNWNITYAPNSNKLTAIKNTNVTENEIIFTIKFKVKSIENIDSTSISLENISISGGRIQDGGTGDIYVNNTSITLKQFINKESSSIEDDNVVQILKKEDSINTIKKSNTELTINTEEIISEDVKNEIEDNKKFKTPKEITFIDNNFENTETEDINIGCVVLGSASSVSFVSIGFMLLRRLKFGI